MFGLKEELLHPVLLHFPIVFLMMGTLIYVALLFPLKNQTKLYAQVLFYFNFYAGLFLMWPTIFLGEIAGDKLRPTLEDVTLLSQHEEWGEYALYIYILAAVLLLALQFYPPLKNKWIQKIGQYIVLAVLLGGSYALIYGSDLGAQLTRI